MLDSLWPRGWQHARPPCPSLSPGVCSDSCPLSQWCCLTILSSAAPSPFAFNLSQHQGPFQQPFKPFLSVWFSGGKYIHIVVQPSPEFFCSLIVQLIKNWPAIQETLVWFLGWEEGIGYRLQYSWASLVAQLVKNLPAMRETWVQSLGWEDPLEKGGSTHCSILAWRIPWTV